MFGAALHRAPRYTGAPRRPRPTSPSAPSSELDAHNFRSRRTLRVLLGRAAWPVEWPPVRRRHHLARFLATEDHARRISIAWWGVSLPRPRLHQARHQIPTDGCVVTATGRSPNRRASPCIDQTAAERSLPRIIGVWARRQIKRHRQRSPSGLEAQGLTSVSE